MACNPEEVKSKRLTIRWTAGGGGGAADDGTRPLPDNTAYWESPDLYLSGGKDQSTAEVGVPNIVWARIFNYGSEAVTGINIEAWVCNFMVGVNPAGSLPSSNPGGAAMTAYYSGTVAPGASADIQVATWTPVPADAALNGGHVCMAGNCFGDNNDNGASFTGTDMRFLCDCHHGQHNIAVVVVPLGQIHRFSFNFYAANPLRERELDTVIAIRPIEAKVELPPRVQQALLTGPHAVVDPRTKALQLASHLGGEAIQLAKVAPSLLQLRHPIATVDAREPLKLALRPHQQERMEAHVQFAPNERPGNVHVFDLTEHDTGGALIGGARLVTVITP
jgi:hypothetical protein